MLAAGVSEERQFGFSHALPEFGIAAIVAVDVVAVGEDFHYGRAASETAVEFLECVGSSGMDRDSGDKFGVFLCEFEHEVIRDIMGTDVFHFLPLLIVNFILRENYDSAQRGSAYQIE